MILMAMETPYEPTDTREPMTEPIPETGVLSKTLLREEYMTRNVRILFAVLIAIGVLGTILWIAQQGISGQPGIVMGLVVGYFAMGLFTVFVAATVVTVVAKSVFLVGRRLADIGSA